MTNDGFTSTDPNIRAQVLAMSQQAEAAARTASTPAPVTSPVADKSSDPLYIGPTNWSTLQKQFTPYQLETATERRGSDIFWKRGVDINSVPAAAPAPGSSLPVPAPQPMPSSAVSSQPPAVTRPDTAVAPTQEIAARNQAASTYLSGIQRTIDDQLKIREELLNKQKTEQEKKVNGLMDRLTGISNETPYQDEFKRVNELFQTETMIRQLGDVRNRIADASAALTQGLIYEESRPVRMQLLVGRSAELKKQGIAQIEALQSSAEIIKGNIDLARAYAEDSISAIKADNAEKRAAINTLLELENTKLITLSEDEKSTAKSRLALLEAESKRVEEDKDAVFELSSKYPDAFIKGGVTYLDSRDTAFRKMAPYLAERDRLMLEQERAQLELTKSQIAENKAQAAKAGRTGTGTGSGGGAGSTGIPLAEEIAQYMAFLKSQGKSEQDIRLEVYANYGGSFKKQSDLASIVDNALQGGAKPADPQKEQSDRILKMRQNAEAKGLLDIDVETGKYTETSNAAEIKKAESAGKIKWNGTNWVDTANNADILDASKIEYNDKGWFTVKDKLRY